MKTKKYTSILFVFIIAILTAFFINKNETENYEEFPNQLYSIWSKDDPNARAEYEFRMVQNPTTGKIPKGIRKKEMEFVKSIPARKIDILDKSNNTQVFNFQSRGPINRGGRTRALGIDIRSTSGNVTIIAAGVSGGIWKSINNGSSWTQTSLPNQINSATCIAQDVRAGYQDTWYIGTGEARGNSTSGGNALYLGDGIFKSVDNGQSWSRILSTVQNTPQSFNSPFNFVHAFAINPITGSLYSAASNVIMRSTNEGMNWTTVRGSLANNTQTFVTVASNGTVYATLNSNVTDKGIWKSTNDGDAWIEITPTNFPQIYKRVIIAVAPSDPDRLYLLAHTPNSGADSPNGVGDEHSFWVSDNGGSSWTERTDNLPDADNVAGYSSQSGYNMVMAVKSDDPNYVIFGGTNLHRSIDAFATKLTNTNTHWIGGYALANNVSQYTNHHPDQHSLIFPPFSSNILYSGNDGGVQVCSNLSQPTIVWSELNNGYQTSQFYSIALDHSSSGDPTLIGGLQDNAHYFTSSNNSNSPWKELDGGGDGAFTAIADGKSSYYIETQNGFLFRFRLDANGNTQNWTVAKPDHSTDYLFVNPYVLDPNNTNRMYFVAGDSLWRNNDLTTIPNYQYNPTDVNWDLLSHTATGNTITAVAASRNPANIVYYGSSNGKIFKLENANSGDPFPTDISTGKGLPSGYVSALAIDEANGENIIAVFSNYEIISLYYTNDGGTSWMSISGNLEQNSDGSGNGPSCRWASILNYGGVKTYFVATSAGLYSTNILNGNSTIWTNESPDKIGVSVCSMVKTRDLDGIVVVSTHGAGVFSADYRTVDVNSNNGQPNSFELYQNYPNPFNPSTTIKYTIPSSEKSEISFVNITVFDLLGREIKTLVNEPQQPGNYKIIFDASNLPSGAYFYRLTTSGFSKTKKLLLLK